MRRVMEVNGVANIKMLLQVKVNKAQDTSVDDGVYYMDSKTYKSLLEQCDLLLEYMKAYNDAVNANQQTPFWHEIKTKMASKA